MTEQTKKTVGLIGGGSMGSRMIGRLTECGWEVILSDRNPKVQERAKSLGAKIAESNVALTEQTDVILVSLPHPDISKAVAKEVADHLKPGMVWLETCTILPQDAREIAEIVTKNGADMLECPILGAPVSVGKWTMIAGGKEDVLERVREVLMCLCTRVVRAGDIGSGNSVKLLNNTMYAAINTSISEVMTIADKAGVDKSIFYEIVANSEAATNCHLFRLSGKRIVDGDFGNSATSTSLICKDNNLGVQFARSVGINPLLAGLTLNIYENATANGLGDLDNAALYQYLHQVYMGK